MRSLVVLAACKQIVERLNPSAFESKVAEYRRGGLPGQSMSDGRGGGQGVPMLDKADKALRRAQRDYRGHLRSALVELEAAQRIENRVMIVAPAVPEEPIVFCDWPGGCTNMLEPGRKRGNCSTHRAAKFQEAQA